MTTNQSKEEEGITAVTGTTLVRSHDSFQDTAEMKLVIKILEDRITETIGLASDGLP